MGLLDEVAVLVAGVAERAGPAIVRVGRRGNGIVVAEGQVLTNAHNVHGPEVPVTLGARTVMATPLGVDADGDVALLGVDTDGVPPLPVGGAPPGIGSTVLAVAAAEPGARVTVGWVSAVARAFRGPRGRRIGGSIEHTAPLAPGSSGSALLDVSGSLVGLNTHRIGAGFYLALPTDAALAARLEALARGETVARPRLGIAVASGRVARRMREAVGLEPRDGLLVREVEAEGPAARAGLRMGDLIVSAGRVPVADVEDLGAAIEAAGGGRLLLVYLRGAEEHSVQISLTG
jgi:serine protease Do